jgi:hypothetical protein
MKARTSIVALMPIETRPAKTSARFRFIASAPGPLRLPKLRKREVVFLTNRHREVEPISCPRSALSAMGNANGGRKA